MTAAPRALPLAPHRDRVDKYLRELEMPYTSLAGEIIARHLERERDLLRASLVLWACEACGGDTEVAVPTAAAIELFYRSETLRDELLGGDPPYGLGSMPQRRRRAQRRRLQSPGRGRRRFATPPALEHDRHHRVRRRHRAPQRRDSLGRSRSRRRTRRRPRKSRAPPAPRRAPPGRGRDS